MGIRDTNDPSRKPTMADDTGGSFANDLTASGGLDDARAVRRSDIDTNAEETFWRDNYTTRPYVTAGTPFNEYRTAYRYGADAHTRFPGRSWDQAETDLGRDWDRHKGTSSLTWDNAKHAARDAWQRVKDAMERAMPGDSDRDGR